MSRRQGGAPLPDYLPATKRGGLPVIVADDEAIHAPPWDIDDNGSRISFWA